MPAEEGEPCRLLAELVGELEPVPETLVVVVEISSSGDVPRFAVVVVEPLEVEPRFVDAEEPVDRVVDVDTVVVDGEMTVFGADLVVVVVVGAGAIMVVVVTGEGVVVVVEIDVEVVVVLTGREVVVGAVVVVSVVVVRGAGVTAIE
jgi:hypothetical protein